MPISSHHIRHIKLHSLIDFFHLSGTKVEASLKKLQELDKTNIKAFAGASAGSLIASLCALGYNPEELDTIMRGLDFNKFFDHSYAVMGEAIDF